MDITGNIKFREFSCYCNSCINEDCIMDMYCSNLIDTKIAPYPSYDKYKTYSDCNWWSFDCNNSHTILYIICLVLSLYVLCFLTQRPKGTMLWTSCTCGEQSSWVVSWFLTMEQTTYFTTLSHMMTCERSRSGISHLRQSSCYPSSVMTFI